MIRRAAVLGLLALAAPLTAAAQATPASGKVTFNDSYVGVSACNADQEVLLSWLAALVSGKAYPTDPRYDIFASSQTGCPTGTTTATLATGYTGASALSVQSYPGGQGAALGVDTGIASKLGFSCTDTTDHTIYVCVNLYSAADPATSLGTADGTFQLQLTAPATGPSGVTVTPNDTALDVSWSRLTGTPTVKDYRARATNTVNTTDVHYSGWVADPETSTTITGLTNNVTYDVAVQARSLGDNEGPFSSPAVQGTPIPIDDFWAHYKNAGGREMGGCGTAGGAGILAALGVLALAVRARRRS